ncbi:MAG: hypothetical protein ACRC42_01320, partial [Mycoplasma sp.]
VDKPVKCWDMSCKELISACPRYQNCPLGTTQCADGSCTATTCGTHITCSVNAPFKCYDNTCRRDPLDCPTAPNCPSESPILCWDGRCLANRGDCFAPTKCPINTPVKCPDNRCRKTVDDCKAIMNCPNEFIRCPNGVCARKWSDCRAQECAFNFPFKCDNGVCVSNEKNCDLDNGCPFNKPFKCLDGKCVDDKENCVKEVNCDTNTRLCPDGSCLPFSIICPLQNGCSIDTPRKCANGTCIDPKKAVCPIPICPEETPIRCIDGSCAITNSNCPNSVKSSTINGWIVCADGTEMKYSEECKPILNCLPDQVRCDDGSCRPFLEYCPKAKTCPNNQIRCANGSCADSIDLCFNLNGCNLKTPNKCPNSGLCVNNFEDCINYEQQFDLSNGCTQSRPLKCQSGKCASTLSDCKEEDECTLQGWVKCVNGECRETWRDCSTTTFNCIQDYVSCPNDSICRSSYNECWNTSKCKFETPFRCMNGECKRYSFKSNPNDADGCSIGIKCPEYKPFICADGQCAEKSTFCKSLSECPQERPFRCFDRTCAANENECLIQGLKCPGKSPILCANSNCVSDIFDCEERNCPSWKPYKCFSGLCKSSPSDCLQVLGKSVTVCTNDETICYDGSCGRNESECPLYPGCITSLLPYKCPDGTCVQSENECSSLEIKCNPGMSLCEDGICRKKCPSYNGCPNAKPLMCSTGICVKTHSECVGEGNCPNVDTPFRCIDGSCASRLSACKSNFRNFGTTNIKISAYPQLDIKADILIGDNNMILGSIYLPADSLFKNDTSTSATLKIKSIPREQIQSTFVSYNQTRTEDILKVFPYADPLNEWKLSYEYGVLSSAVSISLDDPSISFRNFILLTLIYDFPHKHESILNDLSNINSNTSNETLLNFMTLDSLKDTCWGKLENNEWKCLQLGSKTESLSNWQLQGAINSEGIYAVILSPRKNLYPLKVSKNFFFDNWKIIVIVFSVILFI